MNFRSNIKNNRKIRITLLLTAFFVFLTLALFVKNIKAQSKIPLIVSPARQELALNPGDKEKLAVKFINESQIPLSGTVKVVDFIVTGKSGSPILLDNEDQMLSNQFSAASWVKLPFETATIAANDVLRLNFEINVPKDARPGGRYVAIYFETTGLLDQYGNSQTSSTSTRIVSLLSVRINGPINESAFITNFSVPNFLQFGKIPVSFDILNKGDYHITPKGQVTLTNWFNQQTDKIILEPKNVFPDASRTYEYEIGKTFMFGKYSLDVVASYGESGKAVTTTKSIWIIPITLIIIIILTITIIVMLVIYINKKMTQRQKDLERKLEMEINELEELKNKFKDNLGKKR